VSATVVLKFGNDLALSQEMPLTVGNIAFSVGNLSEERRRFMRHDTRCGSPRPSWR
jgi:hypothetical protein